MSELPVDQLKIDGCMDMDIKINSIFIEPYRNMAGIILNILFLQNT